MIYLSDLIPILNNGCQYFCKRFTHGGVVLWSYSVYYIKFRLAFSSLQLMHGEY